MARVTQSRGANRGARPLAFGAESVVTRMSQLVGEPIDISDLPKGRVLAALYNNAKPQGLGFIDANPGFMSENEAGALLAVATFFDYLHGRVMKVNLAGHAFHPWGYDRDNGAGLAAEVVGRLRSTGSTRPIVLHDVMDRTRRAARDALRMVVPGSDLSDVCTLAMSTRPDSVRGATVWGIGRHIG